MLELTSAALEAFRDHLETREYSPAIVTKYVHDVRALIAYAPEGLADKAQFNGFRAFLEAKGYSGSSVNSMLGAVNQFLAFLGSDWRLKYVRVQRRTFLPADKELSQAEYERMVRAATQQGNHRLALIVQTLCSLCLRVSELKAITVESLAAGEAAIRNKGKLRTFSVTAASKRRASIP